MLEREFMKGWSNLDWDSKVVYWALMGIIVASLAVMFSGFHALHRIDTQIAEREGERAQLIGRLDAGIGRTRLQAFESELQGCITPSDIHFVSTMLWPRFAKEAAVDAVANLEQRCAERVIRRVFLANPQEAMSLTSQVQSNGYYLEDDVLDRGNGGLVGPAAMRNTAR